MALFAAVAFSAGAPPDTALMPEKWTPPPEGTALREGGARRAKLMALMYRARRLEREAGETVALPVYLQLLALEPGDFSLVRRVAAVADRCGRRDEALGLLEKSAATATRDPRPLLALSRFSAARASGDPQFHARALLTAHEAAEKFPDSVEVWAHLVRLLISDSRREEAMAAVRRALSRPPTDARWWLALAGPAREAFPLDDPDTRDAHMAIVAGCMEKALALAPTDPAVLEAAADFYGRLSLPAKAVPLYERLMAQQPANLKARHKLGQCLRLTGAMDRAKRIFRDLLEIDSDDLVAHRSLAAMLESEGEKKAALHHRSEVLRIEDGEAADYDKLAGELLDAGLLADAKRLIERGRFQHRESARLAARAAIVQHRTGQARAALALFSETQTLAEKRDTAILDTSFFHAWALCLRDAGERDEAARHFRRAIDLTPKAKPERAAPSFCELAALWLDAGQKIDEAGELLRVAAGLAKDDPAIAETLGWYHSLKGDWPGALREWLRAEKLSPVPPARLTARLADALIHQDRKPEAIERLEKAITRHGPDPSLVKKLDECRRR